MMVCEDCGTESDGRSDFCPRCGGKLVLAQAPGAGQGSSAAPSRIGGEQPPTAYGYNAPPAQPAPPQAYGYNSQQAPAPSYPAREEPPPPSYPPPPTAQAPTPPPRGNLLRNVLLALGLLALVVVGAGAFFLLQSVNKPNIPVAKLIAKDSYGYLSIAPAPKGTQKAALDKLQAAFKDQPGFQAAWDKIFSQATQSSDQVDSSLRTITGDCDGRATPTGTPAVDDFSSYLGNNLSLAVLPLTKSEITALNAGGDPGKLLSTKVLIFLDLDFNPLNKKGLIPTIRTLTEKPDQMPLIEKYRDIEIRKLPQSSCKGAMPDDLQVYLALIGGTAAIAFDPATLHMPIDRYKDGQSLQDTAAFQALEADMPKDRLATFYLNMSSLYDTVLAVVPQDMQESAPQLKQTRIDGTALVVVSAHDEGIQIDSASDIQVNNQALGSTAVPAADALNDIPIGSWAFYRGADLKTILTQALDQARKQGMTADLDQGLAQIKEQTGIDVEQDLLPLLGGDYLLSVQGRKSESGPAFSGMGELRLKAGDGAKMNDLLGKLNKAAADQGSPVESVKVGDATFSKMPPVFYGLVGDKLYIVGDSEGTDAATQQAAEAALNAQGKGIGTDATVKARLGRLPANSTTTLYVDLTKIRADGVEATMSQEDRTSYETDIAPFVRPFQYLLIGGAATTKDNTTHTRGVLFLGIGK